MSNKNPGHAGDTGEFDLTEADVRGSDYVGPQPLEGWEHGGVGAYPYMKAERDPEAPLFEGPYKQRFDRIVARYPNKRAALLPVLNLAQEIRGHLSHEAMDTVAEALDESPAAVRGVATFYTMYNKREIGRYLIQVCTNVACNLCGGQQVFESFLEHTGTEPGQTSEDGNFTVMEVECLGACGFPTAVQINSRYFENVEPQDVPDILERLKGTGTDPSSSSSSSSSSSGGAAASGNSGDGSYPGSPGEAEAQGDSPNTNTGTRPRRGGSKGGEG